MTVFYRVAVAKVDNVNNRPAVEFVLRVTAPNLCPSSTVPVDAFAPLPWKKGNLAPSDAHSKMLTDEWSVPTIF